MRFFNVFAVVAMLLVAGSAFALNLSEIRIDQSGSDYDEYCEVAGTPGESLAGVWLVTIGDGTGGSGVIETALDLSAWSIQPDGVFMVAEDTWTGTCGSADALVAPNGLNFENSDNLTFLLVTDFTGAINDDLDTDEDGILDVTPWSGIIDDVALIETTDVPASGEFYYSDNVVGPDGLYVPGHAAFCGGAWFVLSFDLCLITETPGEPSDDVCGPVANEVRTFGSLKAQYR